MSGTQSGVLRKKNLAKPATIADHPIAEIAYEDGSNIVNVIHADTGRGGVHILSVRLRDGQPVKDGDYIFLPKGDGYFEDDRAIALKIKAGAVV
jgi:hypothetical protein